MTLVMTLTTPAHTRQRAFSLVEVLIALVVMSVGMLGIAGLYVQSMQAGRTSLFRHNAVTLAGDVADRIRANPRAGFAYEGVGGDRGCVATGIDCDQDSMAAHDIFQWDQQAVDSLPSGNVTVIFDDTIAPVSYTITISWVEPGENLNYTIKVPVMGI